MNRYQYNDHSTTCRECCASFFPGDEALHEKKYHQADDLLKTKCRQCGKVMGPEIFLGPVCGKCCKKNHRKAVGKD